MILASLPFSCAYIQYPEELSADFQKNKVVQATEAVEGDVAENLALLLPHVEKVSARPEWLSQIADWKARLPFSYDRGTPDGLIKPQLVIETLSNLTAHMKDRTIITTGVITILLTLPLMVLTNLRSDNIKCGPPSISDGDIPEP